ncbi:MAG: hypothetical protein GY703_00530 [Gammaproteobacteria bacterium]|nr:hypothetical protein [Gammaproteobacteria bacterium]
MFSTLQEIIASLVHQRGIAVKPDDSPTLEKLNHAFLIALSGPHHSQSANALKMLEHCQQSGALADSATFYLDGIQHIAQEVETHGQENPAFQHRLQLLSEAINSDGTGWSAEENTDHFWGLFFPEAIGLSDNTGSAVESLRHRRGITLTRANEQPIQNVPRELIFTSNVLLTIPQASSSLDALPISERLKSRLAAVIREPQLYWYDHPIHLGVEIDSNEVVYGLRGLEAAVQFERERGNITGDDRVTCLLSVSVTHEGLQSIAKDYVEEELSHCETLRNLDIYIFTESDTRQLTDTLLVPMAAETVPNAAGTLDGILGVDGEYGRHYSFLKAITALWPLIQDSRVRGTFKIDLDQVFPQKNLVRETGKSAFEHLQTPLWGADASASDGTPLQLGMIAGALVNERDIGYSLFTPDVPFPRRPPSLDEHIFFSTLPQALSTEAEMMTRYVEGTPFDGIKTAIQRVHVTGGTNGILVEHLRRCRPFTPSFISRAEDQAYILSTLNNPGPGLAYLHADGLIMRHDKEAFAQAAIESAYVGKLIGDYIRILYFSRYAQLLTGNLKSVKERIDPFTGCFVSPIPETLVHLRFALKTLELYAGDKPQQGDEFITTGAPRITAALAFAHPDGPMKQRLKHEQVGWNLYYDTLDRLEHGLQEQSPKALALRSKGKAILRACRIKLTGAPITG